MRPLSNALGRFQSDESGGTTIEFVLWIPFFTLWMALSVGLYDVYMTRNQAAKVANTLADIVSRQDQGISKDFFDLLTNLQQGLMTRAEGRTWFRLSSIQMVDNNPIVNWSCTSTNDLPKLADASVIQAMLPTLQPQENVMLIELFVPWDRFTHLAALSPQEWTFRLPIKPRATPLMALLDAC